MKNPCAFALCLLFALCQNAFAGELIDLSIIGKIESGQNALANNDRAKGFYQITSICLKDYNSFHKVKYNEHDLFNKSINEKIASWYINIRIPQLLKSKGKAISKENVLISYNCGYTCVDKTLPKETAQYLIKYRQYERN